MRPTVKSPLQIRGLEYGGARPLFCIPLVGRDLVDLEAQAIIARDLGADLLEWRADFFGRATAAAFVEAAALLRKTASDPAIIFTLRAKNEGGVQDLSQPTRRTLIDAVLRSGSVDIVDLELANEVDFLVSLMGLAHRHGIRVILAMHDFQSTPPSDVLLDQVRAMRARGADIAKLATMPRTHDDVIRMLQVTIAARREHPDLPLATMSMGGLGSLTRVAGFLYGSDMAFAVGKTASAPGQIPIKEAQLLAEMLLRYS